MNPPGRLRLGYGVDMAGDSVQVSRVPIDATLAERIFYGL